jgi:hypothetical protein
MYIWRGKNRRDRRDFALCGEQLYVPPQITRDPDTDAALGNKASDELKRYEGECKHIEFFTHQIADIMNGYCNTPPGIKELELVMNEVKRDREKNEKLMSEHEKQHELKKELKPIVFQMFSIYSVAHETEAQATDKYVQATKKRELELKYVGDALDYVDPSLEIRKSGLIRLLADLNIYMSKSQFEAFLHALDYYRMGNLKALGHGAAHVDSSTLEAAGVNFEVFYERECWCCERRDDDVVLFLACM